jgi:class 3 adenylate cyclase
VPAALEDAEVLWALLGQPPSSGFDVCATVTAASGRRCTPARVLPALLRLEDAGLVSVDRSVDPYLYALTPSGTRRASPSGSGYPEPMLLVMADLVGFTRFTELHGDVAAHEQASRFAHLGKAAVAPLDGSLVKALGDGVMLGLPALADAVPLVRGLTASLEAGSPGWRLHAAAHVGCPIRHAGDVFGRDVNLVARLCDRAGPDELLVTANDGEQVELAGFEAPVRVRRVVLKAGR